jgi:ABC-type transport system involved in multi-copper enzyme maturation permease subunit
MNPMIWKELQQRMRERRAWLLPTLYLVVLSAIVVFVYYTMVVEETRYSRQELRGAEIGLAVFFGTVFTQLGLLLLIAPALSAGSITIEKEQRTLPGLLTSLLTVLEIWWGKFVASLLLMVLLLVASLPVLSLGLALGGFGLREMVMATVTTLIVIACVNAVGLYCSCLFRRSVHAIPVCYAIVIALVVITFVGGTMSQTLHRGDDPSQHLKPWLYSNPFFFLVLAFAPRAELFPDWFISAGIFVLIAVGTGVLALLQLRRAGEQV